ncbi:MAG TPA: 4Fe-4S binding protein [Conexivisphaerales archaeon]|nr:4Fe-4S binding protein [Conexivisphaerales archaeon]
MLKRVMPSKSAATDFFIILATVVALTFYIYSASGIFVGVLLAVLFGAFTWALLKSTKPYRVRSVYVFGLTAATWIAFYAFISQLGPSYLGKWLATHQRVPLTPDPITNSGFVSILCPYLLPTALGKPVTVQVPVYIKFFSSFPPSIGTFSVIFLAYLGTAFVLGKGWCGWLCPFGGLGETVRQLHRPFKFYTKSVSRIKKASAKRGVNLEGQEQSQMLRDVKYAFLVVTLLLALVYTVQWFCVFCWAGVLGWFASPLNFDIFVAILAVIFLGLPFISTKKWCHSICPIGAGLSMMDGGTPFQIEIDEEACNECYACLNVCPTFGFARKADGAIYVTDTCDKCLVCLYKCPSKAIELHFYNIKTDAKKFLVPSVTVLGAFWFYWFIVVVYNLLVLGVFH